MFTNEQLSDVLGTRALDSDRQLNLAHLAKVTLEGHWHINDLPWDEMPLFPMPENVTGRRKRAFVEFGKRAIKSQLEAEHVAVTAARRLLLQAEQEEMPLSVRRAVAAVLNDEASHVTVMTEMEARAEEQFPEYPLVHSPSPLLPVFMQDIPKLQPALVAAFMGLYEAMIAIRGYAEQASYSRPSILGKMAAHGAEDDGRHAKIMRLVAHEWLDRFRAEPDHIKSDADMRKLILTPIQEYWKLLIRHEYWLLLDDPHQRDTWARRVSEDASLVERVMSLLEFSEEERAFMEITSLAKQVEHQLA